MFSSALKETSRQDELLPVRSRRVVNRTVSPELPDRDGLIPLAVSPVLKFSTL